MLFNNNMSENRTSEGILTLVLSFTALMVSFFAGYNVARHHFADKHEMVTSDTIYIERWDTIKIIEPREMTRYVLRYDTIQTIIVDSVEIAPNAIIPIELAVYRDSTENAKYEAYISGYKAALDSIIINCRQIETTITITERIPARRFGVGIQAGYGFSGHLAPYIGVGIQYRLW